ncbi:MAG: flap endonuclease [Verrucomicrobia bacterium]|nr:MAG: flap endonuclease [Verrucomicrobiota bacterium]
MRILLIDGHYYIYRSFHAIRNLRNSRGEPTNAIYGFVRAIRRMLVDLRPELGAVIWDSGPPTRRLALQSTYKQHRAEMPDALRFQEPLIQELCPLLGLSSLSLPEVEADDLIACYTEAAAALGIEVDIATNDKDLLQLVRPGVFVYSTSKADLVAPSDTCALLGEGDVLKKWGVPPAHIGEVLALTGDASDNISGVEGVGPKTATELIRQYGKVSNLLENLKKIKNENLRKKLEVARERILQNREMIRLDLDLPLPLPVKDLRINPQFRQLIKELERYEFNSILAEVKREAEGGSGAAQKELFSSDA